MIHYFRMAAVANILPIIPAALFVAGLIFLAHLLGTRITTLVRFQGQSRLESFLVRQGLGLALVAYLLFIIGLFGGMQKKVVMPVFIILIPLLFSPFLIKTVQELTALIARLWHVLTQKKSRIATVLILFLTLAALLALANAILPPHSVDEVKYHLRVPQRYVQTGTISPLPSNIYSYFPQLAEMLFTLGLLLTNDITPHLIHWYFGILAALTVFIAAQRIANQRAGLVCMLLFYTTPLVIVLSGWAYVDLTLCFYQILGLTLFFRALTTNNKPALCVAALLFGAALSVKYLTLTALAVTALLWLAVFLHRKRQRSTLIKQGFLFAGITLLAGSPWYVRNAITTGNPVYPFFYALFGGNGWDQQRALWYDIFLGSYGMGKSLLDLLLLPWRTFKYGTPQQPFDGNLGLAALVFIPLLLVRSPKKPLAQALGFFGIGSLLIWFYTSQQVRFLLPSIAALSISCAHLFTNKKRPLLTLVAIAVICANLVVAVKEMNGYDITRYLSGKLARTPFLLRNVKSFAGLEYINEKLPRDAKTLMIFTGSSGYYSQKPYYQESVFEDYTFKRLLLSAPGSGALLTWLRDNGITHIMIDENITLGDPQENHEYHTRYRLFKERFLNVAGGNKNMMLYRIRFP